MSARARLKIDVRDLPAALADAQDALEDATDVYVKDLDVEARAEDAYKRLYHTTRVQLLAEDAGRIKADRRTVGEVESLAMVACADEHGVYLIKAAAVKASAARLKTALSRVEVTRSISTTQRALTS